MSFDFAKQQGNSVIVKCSNPSRTTSFAGILVSWTPTTITVKDRCTGTVRVYDEKHHCIASGK